MKPEITDRYQGPEANPPHAHNYEAGACKEAAMPAEGKREREALLSQNPIWNAEQRSTNKRPQIKPELTDDEDEAAYALARVKVHSAPTKPANPKKKPRTSDSVVPAAAGSGATAGSSSSSSSTVGAPATATVSIRITTPIPFFDLASLHNMPFAGPAFESPPFHPSALQRVPTPYGYFTMPTGSFLADEKMGAFHSRSVSPFGGSSGGVGGSGGSGGSLSQSALLSSDSEWAAMFGRIGGGGEVLLGTYLRTGSPYSSRAADYGSSEPVSLDASCVLSHTSETPSQALRGINSDDVELPPLPVSRVSCPLTLTPIISTY